MENLWLFIVNFIFGFVSHEGTTFSLFGGINKKGAVVSLVSFFTKAPYSYSSSYSLINIVSVSSRLSSIISVVSYDCFDGAFLINIFSFKSCNMKIYLFNLLSHSRYEVIVKGISIYARGDQDTKVGLGLVTIKRRR